MSTDTYNPKIGICMIVKDEEAVIERVLRSTLSWADTWCIVDTGSTDKTMEIIQRIADEFKKPGHLYERPWVNFGQNRTESLELARKHMDWAFVIDADDTAEGQPPAKDLFKADVSALKVDIHHGTLKHSRVQFFNSKFQWKYVGALHEYPHCEGAPPASSLPPTFYVHTRVEGARSKDPNKYAKDAELLERELEKEPNNDRTMFYLAQSYRDSGQVEKAKAMYARRLAAGGWIEEQYMSLVNIIKLTADIQMKVQLAWKAQNLIPHRLEAAYYAISAARRVDHFTQEVLAMALLPKNRMIRQNYLFAEKYIYEYAFDDEACIIAYHTKAYQESFHFGQRAVLLAPPDQKQRMTANIGFAEQKLGMI